MTALLGSEVGAVPRIRVRGIVQNRAWGYGGMIPKGAIPHGMMASGDECSHEVETIGSGWDRRRDGGLVG